MSALPTWASPKRTPDATTATSDSAVSPNQERPALRAPPGSVRRRAETEARRRTRLVPAHRSCPHVAGESVELRRKPSRRPEDGRTPEGADVHDARRERQKRDGPAAERVAARGTVG